jgi:hypothetical protein
MPARNSAKRQHKRLLPPRPKRTPPVICLDKLYNGTMSFDPGETGLGWAVVSYVGEEENYNDPRSYLVRNCGVLNIISRGSGLTEIMAELYRLLTTPELLRYTADTALTKVVESQEGFTFGTGPMLHGNWKFTHQMVRMGAISGMIAGSLTAMGNSVRYMTKCEKFRKGMDHTGRGLPDKRARVAFVQDVLKKQHNAKIGEHIKSLGHMLRPKAMEDASDAILMAMENTRKMAAASCGIWPAR